jgi:hypothetical membrane protein
VTGARAAAVAGLTGPPLASAVVIAAGWLSPGYDPLHRTVSRLAEAGAPYAAIVNLTLAGLGLSLLAAAWALRGRLWGRGRLGAVALALAGVALVGVAVLSRHSGDPVRLVAHRAAALTLFLALASAPPLAGACLRSDPAWRGWAGFSLAAGAASLALLVAAAALLRLGVLPAGAWERMYVGVNLLWVTLLSARLLRL